MKKRFIKALSYVLFQLGLAYTSIGVGLDNKAFRVIEGELRTLVANGYIRSAEASKITDIITKVDKKLKEGEFKHIILLIEEVYEEE